MVHKRLSNYLRGAHDEALRLMRKHKHTRTGLKYAEVLDAVNQAINALEG